MILSSQKDPPAGCFPVLMKLEPTLQKFAFPLLTESGFNYRNIIIQNLFKAFGLLREKSEKNAHCKAIEFFASEFQKQMSITSESFRNSMNLKSMVTMAFCMSGGFNRIYDDRRLGCCHSKLFEILYCRTQNQKRGLGGIPRNKKLD